MERRARPADVEFRRSLVRVGDIPGPGLGADVGVKLGCGVAVAE